MKREQERGGRVARAKPDTAGVMHARVFGSDGRALTALTGEKELKSRKEWVVESPRT